MRQDGRGARHTKHSHSSSARIDAAPLILLCILMILPTLAILRLSWHPPLAFAYLFAISIGTFCAYSFDKGLAVTSATRLSEYSLHLLDLLGGWPGGLLAQYLVRHKNAKPSFQLVYWLTVFAHQFFALEIVSGGHVTSRLITTLTRGV